MSSSAPEPRRFENRRVVITGTGLVTAVGKDVQSTWTSLLEGVSGAGPITQFDPSEYPVRFACEVKDFDPAEYMDRKEAKRTDRYAQFAVAGAVQAMREAGLDESLTGVDPERVGVVVGSGIGGIQTFEEQHAKMVERGPSRVSPFFIPMFISDIAAGLISIRYGAKGPNYGTVSACATGAHAIGNALRHIRAGDADVIIAGGAEASVTPMAIAGFANMQALSTRNESPETASRPFDADRDGFVMGEGAGVMVLEELEHARARGAQIIAELVGYGLTGDAHHLTGQPSEHEGLARAMRMALRDGGADVGEVAYVNAHGTSTPLNDSNESIAIRRVLGDRVREVVVGSTKSMTGHTLGAAGAIEGVITALVCQHSIIPPTINLRNPDPACDLDYAADGAREAPVRLALSNSAGFGGHNVSLAIRRWED